MEPYKIATIISFGIAIPAISILFLSLVVGGRI